MAPVLAPSTVRAEPRGAAVYPYHGKRGTVWRIKYADASGEQVMETVGAERDGITRKSRSRAARSSCQGRAEGLPEPAPAHVRRLRETWFDAGPQKRRGWKPATLVDVPQRPPASRRLFGPMPLAAIRPRHVAEYVAEQPESSARDDRPGPRRCFSRCSRPRSARNSSTRTRPRPRNGRSCLGAAGGSSSLPRSRRRLARRSRRPQARVGVPDARPYRPSPLRAAGARWRDLDLAGRPPRPRRSQRGRKPFSRALTGAAEELWQYRRRSNSRAKGSSSSAIRSGAVYRAARVRAGAQRRSGRAGIEGTRPGVPRPAPHRNHERRRGGPSADRGDGEGRHANMRDDEALSAPAGVVFRDEAEGLEERLLGGGLSTPVSTHLSAPEPLSSDPAPLHTDRIGHVRPALGEPAVLGSPQLRPQQSGGRVDGGHCRLVGGDAAAESESFPCSGMDAVCVVAASAPRWLSGAAIRSARDGARTSGMASRTTQPVEAHLDKKSRRRPLRALLLVVPRSSRSWSARTTA